MGCRLATQRFARASRRWRVRRTVRARIRRLAANWLAANGGVWRSAFYGARRDLGQTPDTLDLAHRRLAAFAVVSPERSQHRAGAPGHDGHAPRAHVPQRPRQMLELCPLVIGEEV